MIISHSMIFVLYFFSPVVFYFLLSKTEKTKREKNYKETVTTSETNNNSKNKI